MVSHAPTLPHVTVEQELARWHIPGAAVAVFRHGQIEAAGYGVASLETRQPITPETVFRVASISKMFTATLVMALVDAGLLDLDRPVAEYLPDLALADAPARREVSVRLLLSHQSGLWGDFSPDCGTGAEALSRAVARFGTLRQLTAPREVWAYCNAGFHLTGAVIERVTGGSFEAAMQRYVLGPLGLTRTGYFWHEVIPFPIAVGYNQTEPGGDEHEPADQYYPRNRNPAGGIITTVHDLLRFAEMHLHDGQFAGQPVLSEASARAMREPQIRAGNFADEWGIGWDIRHLNGPGGTVTAIGHGGSINGYQSRLTLIPAHRFAFVILTNSGRGSAAYRGIETDILHRELGITFPEPAIRALDPAALQRLTGTYEQPLGRLTVSVVDGGLDVASMAKHPRTGKFVPYPSVRLLPTGERSFVVSGGETDGSRAEFIGDQAGAPRFLRLGGRLAERNDNPAAEPRAWI